MVLKKHVYTCLIMSCILFQGISMHAQTYIKNGAFTNPVSGTGNVPEEWIACSESSTPDIFYQYENSAGGIESLDQSQFVRLRVRGEDYTGSTHPKRSYEGLYTKLNTPLEKGYCYTLSIELAYVYGERSRSPGIFQIWATNNTCNPNKMVFESPIIDNEEFQQFHFSFQVTDSNYNYIFIRPNCDTVAFNNFLYNTIVCVDNIKIEKKGIIGVQYYDTVQFTRSPPLQLNAIAGALYTWNEADFLSNPKIQKPILQTFVPDLYVKVENYTNDICPIKHNFHVLFNCDEIYTNDTLFEQDVYYYPENNIEFNTISGSETYEWSPAEYLNDKNAAKPLFTGYGNNFKDVVHFNIRMKDEYNCTFFENINLIRNCDSIYSEEGIIERLDTTFEQNPSIVLETKGKILENWTTANGQDESLTCLNCNSPLATPVSSEIYTIKLNNEIECPHYEIFRVDVNIFIPNVFTPGQGKNDGDGVNDVFAIPGLPMGSKIKIFDKYGKLLFIEDQNYNKENWWDGSYLGKYEKVNTGTYWYVLEIAGQSDAVTGYIFVKRE